MMHTQTRVTPRLAARRRAGFSLVEMIGVLAIIAILAVVIVPKVFSTIASSRVTAAVASVNSMKTAVTEFAGKFGTIPTTNNNSRIDDLLATAGITDSRFLVKIGTQPTNPAPVGAAWARDAAGTWAATGGASQTGQSRLICQTSTTNAPSQSGGRNYYLNGGTAGIAPGARVVSAVLINVTGTDAHEFSLRMDGNQFSEANATTADNNGKVVYAAPNAQGLTNVYVYVVHQ